MTATQRPALVPVFTIDGRWRTSDDDHGYWLQVAIDGSIRTILITARSEQEVLRRPHAYLAAAIVANETRHGELTVE
jgi:hypothetical protein